MSITNDSIKTRALNYASATLSDLIDGASELYEAVTLFSLMAAEVDIPVSSSALKEIASMSEVIIRMLGADGRSFSCASERCPAYLLCADGTIEPIE